MATRKRAEASSEAVRDRGSKSSTAAAAQEQTESQLQLKHLEEGLRLFRAQRFAEAKEWFEKVSRGPQLAVSHTAKQHLTVCARRIQKPALNLETADDHYNYGIERLNARDLDTAKKHLEVAVALNPKADHMLYALAAAQAQGGDVSGSFENLKRAIEAEPRNRNSARHDADFAPVIHSPLFAQLLDPNKQVF